MPDVIRIHNTDIVPLIHQDIRVITLDMMDELHERPKGTAYRTFKYHQQRLSEGKHYFLRNSLEAKALGITAPNGLTLLTETGYLMLVKSFRDDLAWTVQEQLVESYFRARAVIPAVKNPAHQMLIDTIVRLDAVEQRAIAAETVAAQAKDLALQAYQEAQMQTIAEFVYFHKLTHQLPPGIIRQEFGRYMTGYCLEQNIPLREIAVPGQRWAKEKAYPAPLLHQLLWPWLQRYGGQVRLEDIGDQGIHYETES